MVAAARWAPTAACGLKGRILALRLAILWMRFQAWAWRNNFRALLQIYPKTYATLETFHRLQFISNHIHADNRRHSGDAPEQSMNTIGAATLFGLLPARTIRRTHISLVRGSWNDRLRFADRVIRFRDRHRRYSGSSGLLPCRCLFQRPSTERLILICLSEDRICGRIGPDHFRPDGLQYLVLVCIPICRSDMHAPDRRELGFPLFGFRVEQHKSAPELQVAAD